MTNSDYLWSCGYVWVKSGPCRPTWYHCPATLASRPCCTGYVCDVRRDSLMTCSPCHLRCHNPNYEKNSGTNENSAVHRPLVAEARSVLVNCNEVLFKKHTKFLKKNSAVSTTAMVHIHVANILTYSWNAPRSPLPNSLLTPEFWMNIKKF